MVNRQRLVASSGKQSGHERVLAAVKHHLAEGRYEGGMLPSYRQLVRQLNVTRASVERAMAELEREGLIKRENRRGAFPCAQRGSVAPVKPLPLQCINFVMPKFGRIASFAEAEYLAGYTDVLEHLAVRMRFVTKTELGNDYDRLFSRVLPIGAQGVVLINNACEPGPVEWLQRNSVPFVVQYYSRYDTSKLPPHFGVYVNKSGGAFQAVNHLMELGHRRIGFMGFFDSTAVGIGTAFEGLRAALNCAGLDCAEEEIVRCGTEDRQANVVIAKSFLARRQRPTAMLAGCDSMAQAMLDAAHALNIRIPEELSVVGFNNEMDSAQADPPLTTVSVPRRELAKSAVELLLEAAKGPHMQPRMRILDTHLIIRKTTAPPPAPGGQRH